MVEEGVEVCCPCGVCWETGLCFAFPGYAVRALYASVLFHAVHRIESLTWKPVILWEIWNKGKNTSRK